MVGKGGRSVAYFLQVETEEQSSSFCSRSVELVNSRADGPPRSSWVQGSFVLDSILVSPGATHEQWESLLWLFSSQKLFPQHVDSQHLKCVSKDERSTLFFQASAIFNIKLEMQWGGVCLIRSNIIIVRSNLTSWSSHAWLQGGAPWELT